MERFYNVTFVCNGVYCANIAHGTTESINAHYADVIAITPASSYDIDNAKRRGMPINYL